MAGFDKPTRKRWRRSSSRSDGDPEGEGEARVIPPSPPNAIRPSRGALLLCKVSGGSDETSSPGANLIARSAIRRARPMDGPSHQKRQDAFLTPPAAPDRRGTGKWRVNPDHGVEVGDRPARLRRSFATLRHATGITVVAHPSPPNAIRPPRGALLLYKESGGLDETSSPGANLNSAFERRWPIGWKPGMAAVTLRFDKFAGSEFDRA